MKSNKNTELFSCPDPSFEWPQFKSERERIKLNSARFKEESIADAFCKCYNMKLKKHRDELSVYHDVRVGEIIPLKIIYVDKKTVTFESGSYKEVIESAVNLYQYASFKSGKLPNKPVACKVVSKTSNKIVVDPLAPMFDEWLKDKLDNIKNQYDVNADRSICVKNLKILRGSYQGAVSGGFQGDVRVDNVSKFCGQDVYLKAFIPGSQIVLNIERDFDIWEGETVRAFITNYVERKDRFGGTQMSLICSAKEYLKFQGDKAKIEIFNAYCLNGEEWQNYQKAVWLGKVTGIINSSKRQGVFVEVPTLNITGLIEMKPEDLVYYHPGDEVRVNLARIDEPMVYNPVVDQMQHKASFEITNGILKKCNLRFVFGIVRV